MPNSSKPSTSAAGAIVVAGGAAANGPTALLSSGFLAPGFRFHPTDEELVIYYLKRKISGRPLRIEAIAEIDVYKHEPWDLPALSRLRTRDVEWYFFTPLDRKLSNRLRTNRGTPAGYWKTTGKDRPVRRCSSASAVVGFKKTLVFHTGRAPKGQRTNWVMHEFRLDDKELARKGICQDGYVLCRIFQKSGPGPQIGEQHGAPFVEEEWADPDEVVLSREGEEVEGFNSNGGLDYLQLTDVEQVNPNIYIATDGKVGVAEQHGSFLKEDDGFLQLDDIAQNGVNNSYIADSFQHSDGMYNYQKSAVEVGGSSNFPEKDGGEFFDAYNGNADQTYPYQTCATAMDNTYVHLGDLPNHVADDCLIGQAADDTYYDAICHGVPTAKENFVQMNDSCQPMADSCEFDMFDAVIEYLNDTDDNLHYNLESLEKLEKVNLPLKANIGTSIYSPVGVPEADDQSNITSESVIVKKDTQKNETQKNKPLKGRLLNMLGAIPSPPAFACEFPLTMKPSRQYCGNQTISNHVAADMHQMSEVWPLQNSRDMSFLLSCGMNGESLKPTRKSACGVLMMVFKSGLYLGFSALVLVASLTVGVYLNMR